MTKYSVRLAAIASALSLLACTAYAKDKLPHMPTAAELATLPEYCQARMGTDQVLRNTWNQRMGPKIFMHLHHYCHGLKDMNRATNATHPRSRSRYLRSASGQFNYVIKRWPANYELTLNAQRQRTLALAMAGQR